MHRDVATLAPDSRTVKCALFFDQQSGGVIVMRHAHCVSNLTDHCTKSKTHISSMIARERQIEVDVKMKRKGKQQPLGGWFNAKKRKSKYDKRPEKEDAASDAALERADVACDRVGLPAKQSKTELASTKNPYQHPLGWQ